VKVQLDRYILDFAGCCYSGQSLDCHQLGASRAGCAGRSIRRYAAGCRSVPLQLVASLITSGCAIECCLEMPDILHLMSIALLDGVPRNAYSGPLATQMILRDCALRMASNTQTA